MEPSLMNVSTMNVILAIIIATLAAIIYSLKIVILIERRVARMEQHIENIAGKLLHEEFKIERMLGSKPRTARIAKSRKKPRSRR